ncbi:MAG: hypothetical protein AAB516_00015 [Patescibacteria group bacterium]
MTKKQLGQFFTTNSDYILQNLEKYIKGKEVIDPFAGNGDLIGWAKKNGARKIKGFDVDKKLVDGKIIFHNDGILNPKRYKFVLTNPPYLNVNKADDSIKKKYFRMSEFEDFYQISLFSLMNSEEGIVIVPINFLSAENSRKIRNLFFYKFKIIEMNYFKQQVFSDTTYNVIAFYYKKKEDSLEDKFSIKTHIYPDNKLTDIELNRKFYWTIGGELLSKIWHQQNVLGIRRLTEKDLENERGPIKIRAAYNHIKDLLEINISKEMYDLLHSNIILLKAIDSGSENGKLALENIKDYGVECLISKESSRHMIYLIFDEPLKTNEQNKIIELFNNEINKLRETHLSLFLTNYRDKDRKRVSFDFVYKFINYLYFNKLNRSRENNLFVNQ